MIWVVAIFIIYFFVDFAWAVYIKALGENRYVKAALWSGFIALISGITIIKYVDNHWLLVPAVVGGMIGTYCSKYLHK